MACIRSLKLRFLHGEGGGANDKRHGLSRDGGGVQQRDTVALVDQRLDTTKER
jgi:hypothetical protein